MADDSESVKRWLVAIAKADSCDLSIGYRPPRLSAGFSSWIFNLIMQQHLTYSLIFFYSVYIRILTDKSSARDAPLSQPHIIFLDDWLGPTYGYRLSRRLLNIELVANDPCHSDYGTTGGTFLHQKGFNRSTTPLRVSIMK